MATRKRWTTAEATPALIKFREKRKWQINFRRYVLLQNPAPFYAPYYGLDIKKMRQWFEYQFKEGVSWETFGKNWQFDHIIPVTYFDFSKEEDLKMCWNFTNIRVEIFQQNKDGGNSVDILSSKNYFQDLYNKTGYEMCYKLLKKVEEIEISEILSTKAQQAFINKHKDYLKLIEGYSVFEYELLNTGRSLEDVKREMELFKNLGN